LYFLISKKPTLAKETTANNISLKESGNKIIQTIPIFSIVQAHEKPGRSNQIRNKSSRRNELANYFQVGLF